ncbi:MAG: pyridoxal-phosphate-dependent aminotransferase family protein [Vulcanimicrobiaceae bacterium]
MLLFLPGPVCVADEVLAVASRPLIDHRGPEFAALLARIVEGCKPIFGTSGAVLVLGSSGTGGLEAALTSLFSPGDHLLACPVGVFGERLVGIAQAFGCEVEVLPTAYGAALDPAALAMRLRADTQRRITGVLLTHSETSTGVQNDLAALAPCLREHGALTLVDSVSGLAASPMRMDEWGYDAVVSASQKALAAPPGVAMVALGARAVGKLKQTRCSRYYFDLRVALEFAEKAQTPWTPPISILCALDVALERYRQEGSLAAFARHARHAQMISEALVAMGFELFSQPGAHSVTVVAARPPQGVEVAPLLESLRQRYGVVLSGGQGPLSGKIVRMGTMGAIDERDVRDALAAIKAVLDTATP